MKILYLITKSETGGAQTHVAQLCRHFLARGHEVAVMSAPGGWMEEKVRKTGARFYANEFFSNSLNPFQVAKEYAEIKKAIKDFHPDLVSCHSSVAGFLGRFAARRAAPVVFTAHGWSFDEGMPAWKKFLTILAEKLAARYSAKIICVAKYVMDSALKNKIASPSKFAMIYNGMEPIEPVIRDNSGKTKIIFVGRLSPQKDPMLLLAAYQNLAPEIKSVAELTIIGNGPDYGKLEKFVRDHGVRGVNFILNCSRFDVIAAMKSSDIFVLPTNWEGFPYTVLEAMSCGLPVVATGVGGVREAIDGCGLVIERGDVAGLVGALEKLIKNPGLRKELGARAKAKADRDFSLSKMFVQTESLYTNLPKHV